MRRYRRHAVDGPPEVRGLQGSGRWRQAGVAEYTGCMGFGAGLCCGGGRGGCEGGGDAWVRRGGVFGRRRRVVREVCRTCKRSSFMEYHALFTREYRTSHANPVPSSLPRSTFASRTTTNASRSHGTKKRPTH